MTMRALLPGAAGVGRVWRSASCIVGKAPSGFHLLRVEAYSQTKTVPGGESIDSTIFHIGRHKWHLKYYPNGRDTSSTNSDYISLYLGLRGFPSDDRRLEAQYKLSILDHAGNIAYGLPPKTVDFDYGGKRLCGHEHFIRREDLERLDDLIKDDCVVFRCDVGGFTTLNTSCVTPKDSDNDDDIDDDEYGLRPSSKKFDDNKFVQWCLAQKHVG